MRAGQELPDHAAHRDAHDVRLADLEGVHQAQRILDHVVQRVGCKVATDHAGGDLGDGMGRVCAMHLRCQPNVAVVKGDDAKACARKFRHERVGPEGHLCCEAHDHDDGRPVLRAVLGIFNHQPVCGDLWHGTFVRYSAADTMVSFGLRLRGRLFFGAGSALVSAG